MSIPSDIIAGILDDLSQSRINNLIAQADARRILQEVKELSENYPNFDSELTDKATHIAYALLSCGCSMVENEDSETAEGLLVLEKAGKILSDVFKYNDDEPETKDYNLLISGMALYAAKQYSRAFIILNDIDADFAVGQMIIAFVKKDFHSLLQTATNIFFSQAPEPLDLYGYDEWIMTHEIARCFLVITDFIHTGQQESIGLTSEILNKLMTIASQDNLTLYWLILRLLRIIFATFQTASLWTVLPPLLPVKKISEDYIRLLAGFSSPVTEIWPSQSAALPLALDDNNGAVINLRTSGGKTRVAEIAILKTLSTNIMSKVLYLAPFRSLAFEIEQSLNKTFGPLGIVVSQLYGGSTANVTDFELIKQSQVIIATPEKAKALIRCGSGLETEIKLIVVDEGHLLGADTRNIKNEIFLTHLKEFATQNEIRMLLLSAVLPNADDMAQWIAEDASLVAKSEWKPALERLGLLLWDGSRVRLEWKSDGEPFNPNFIQKAPLGFGGRRNLFPNNKNEAVAATAVRLAQTGTVMIFSARANSIEGLAKSVLLALGEHPDDFPWDQSLWNVFESICAEELNDDGIVLSAARKGIICHNNRLPALVRIAIERLMRSKPPLIIIASTTLGQGVNIGISTVIVSTPYLTQDPISNRDFWNICGRAGRAFSDTEGKILYAIDTTQKQWKVQKNRELARSYFDNRQMEKVQSGVLAVLRAIFRNAQRANVDFNVLIEAIANDTLDIDISEGFSKGFNNLLDYIDDELLSMHEDFCTNEDDVSWVDGVFRKSLALIQAESENEERSIALLQARTKALLSRVPNKITRKRLVASGIPLSVSRALFESIDHFRSLALSFILSSSEAEQFEHINNIVREIEIWSNENANSLMDAVPEQEVLDIMRTNWISGTPLVEIIEIEPAAEKITKDYYGFTLPWIIHALSQMFDQESEEIFIQVYASIAMYVELGLPKLAATNIYMAGVRSRSAALELSAFDGFKDKTISEIKQILVNFPYDEMNVSDSARAWIELFSETARLQAPKKVFFPAFTWERSDLPDKLYLRKHADDCYLISSDGYFFEKTESTNDLPFSRIADINGLYFERRNHDWILKSYNPHIIVNGESL